MIVNFSVCNAYDQDRRLEIISARRRACVANLLKLGYEDPEMFGCDQGESMEFKKSAIMFPATLTKDELVAFAAVCKAYGVRTEARARAKEAKVALANAEREERHFGRFEDCGGSYRSWLDEAKGVFSAAVSSEITSEKAFKKARLTAIEQHPRLEPLIEEVVYPYPRSTSNAA